MTAVLEAVPCTREVLEAVPVGGRIVREFGYGSKIVLHKVGDDAWVWGVASTLHAFSVVCPWSTKSLSPFDGEPVTVHQPGLVRVRQLVDDTLGAHWGWHCRICDDAGDFLATPAAAGDWARAHITNHVETARAF